MDSKIDKIIETEERLNNYLGEDRIISSLELRDLLEKTKTVNTSHATGFPFLDRILDKTESGELIIVSGPTGNGKTTLLTSITKNLTAKSAWFTLEVPPRQFLSTFGDNLPLFYTPAKNTDSNIQWVIERIIEAKVKYDIQVVFIDHLHQLFSIDRFNGRNLSLELGDIVAKIKQLAIQYDIVIWLVAHSTDDKTRTTREPKMMDIRDSGMISRLADVVMGVWRIPNSDDGTSGILTDDFKEEDNRAKVRVWKNRRTGKLGWFLMEHKNHYMQEINMDQKENFTEKQNKAKELDKQYGLL